MLGALSGFVVMLLLVEAVESTQAQATRHTLQLIEDEAFPSVQLLDQIARDVQRERLLIDRHIFQSADADRERIERQIAQVRTDYAEKANRYLEIAMLPGEATLWSKLWSDVAATREPEDHALALSRRDFDSEAQRELEKMAPLFATIDRDAQELISMNQRAAENSVATLRLRHHNYTRSRLTLITGMLLVAVLGGAWVTRKVVRAQAGLARLNDELENRNRELDAFGGRIAHDLRGPLSTIGLAAEVLANSLPEAKTTTTTISRSVNRIGRLIDDLLLLSRVGTMPRTAARSDAIAGSLQEDLGRLVAEAQGKLRVDLGPAYVACSDALLRQVLWNLGENAVKYRRADVAPDLEIVGRVERGRYAIKVRDNGMGMSDEDRRRAFEPFYRGREVSSIPGTGLGLAIVRRIVEGCGGRVVVESEPARGTTFVIELPLASGVPSST